MVDEGSFRLLYPPGKRKKPSFNCGDFQQYGRLPNPGRRSQRHIRQSAQAIRLINLTARGRYSDSPTLPPLQGALNLLSLNGYDYPDIQRALLAEKADASLIQWDATVATLKALGCQNIDRVLLG